MYICSILSVIMYSWVKVLYTSDEGPSYVNIVKVNVTYSLSIGAGENIEIQLLCEMTPPVFIIFVKISRLFKITMML